MTEGENRKGQQDKTIGSDFRKVAGTSVDFLIKHGTTSCKENQGHHAGPENTRE